MRVVTAPCMGAEQGGKSTECVHFKWFCSIGAAMHYLCQRKHISYPFISCIDSNTTLQLYMIRLCLGNHVQKYVPNPCRNSPVAGISGFFQILTWTSSETAPRNTFSVGSGEGPRSGRRRKGCDPGLPILWGFLKPWGASETCNIGNV